MHARTPKATREQIVTMYKQGEAIACIAEATGSGAIHSVLRQEGIEPDRSPRLRNPETRKQLSRLAQEAMRRAATELGTDRLRIASYREWRKTTRHDAPDESTIKRLFGSWADAVKAAGLRSAQHATDQSWDEDDLLGWLSDAAGPSRTLTRQGYDQWRAEHCSTAPTAQQIHSKCGWTAMLSKAGLMTRRRGPTFTRADVTATLRKAGDGFNISMRAYTHWRQNQETPTPSVATICDRYGSWRQACTEARLKSLHTLTDKQLGLPPV